jgi:preprotein translocase subunit SecG
MGWLIGLLTFVLVVNCLFLCLLVLAQKPKKDTGGGLAFGGGASDALFGAGSGDLFTKMTKYATVIFFLLTLILSILSAQHARRKGGDPRLRVSMSERQADLPIAAKPAAPNTPSTSPTSTNAAVTPGSNALQMLGTNLISKFTNPASTSASTTTAPPAQAPTAAKPKAEDEKK